MSAAQVLEMALYDPNEKEEAMTPLNFRVPKGLIRQMDACVRLWRIQAKARGEETGKIDRSYIMRMFLRDGWENAFDEFGGMPTDDAGWESIEAKILKSVKKTSTSR